MEPHPFGAEFRKAWVLNSCILPVIFCLRSLSLIFLGISGRDLQEVVVGEVAGAGVCVPSLGWQWMVLSREVEGMLYFSAVSAFFGPFQK